MVNRLRDLGILAGTDGPHDNVLKLRPSLVFAAGDADYFVETLDGVLQEDAVQPGPFAYGSSRTRKFLNSTGEPSDSRQR